MSTGSRRMSLPLLFIVVVTLSLTNPSAEDDTCSTFRNCQGTKLKMMLESATMFLNKAQDFVQDVNERTTGGDESGNTCPDHPVDCEEILRCGNRKNGTYTVWPRSRLIPGSVNVYCDMETDGGGWTVIQRRGDFGRPRDYFFNDWNAYKMGFGDLSQDFWLGNDFLFAFTNQRLYSLRVDLKTLEGESRFALYDNFWIDSEQYDYYLHVRGYTGTAGDSFSSHNGVGFSTKDRDNDKDEKSSCALTYKGGWWYDKCHRANLNGLYLNGTHSSFADGVEWHAWRGYNYSFPFAEMKIRSFRSLLRRQNELTLIPAK